MILHPVETIEIPTSGEFPVRGDLYVPGTQPARGLVVLAHGFKGYKTWGFLPYLATRLCGAGLVALSIDFSFNGTFPETPPGDLRGVGRSGRRPVTRYPRADLFRNNTLRLEYEDLRAVIRFVEDNHVVPYVHSPVPLGLFGHSRGGVAAILNAIENDRIKALCTWSAPDNPDSFTPRQKEKWRRHGEYDFTDARYGTRLSISIRYLEDLEENHDTYDLCRRAADLRVPHLIVHGEMDLVVQAASARALYAAERRLVDKRLLILRTGHTFGGDESPDGPPGPPSRALVEAADATVNWFETHLKKGT